MIKKAGKCYNYVCAYLRGRGMSTEGISVVTLPRSGSQHLIVKGEDIIGDYNHASREVSLYSDADWSRQEEGAKE